MNKPPLPECVHRSNTESNGKVYCASNRILGTPGIVSESTCLRFFNGEWRDCPYVNVPNSIEKKSQVEPCTHIGEENGRIDCPSCCGTVKVKTFHCAVHGSCTLGKALDDVACCEGCADYQCGFSTIRRNPC